MRRMLGSDIGWCRYYGKTGADADRERRKVKRSERHKVKKDIARSY